MAAGSVQHPTIRMRPARHGHAKPVGFAFILASISLMGCAEETEAPDGEWEVTVTGDANSCTTSTEGYEENFVYQLFYDGSETTVEIDGEGFASGTTSGCTLNYTSQTWLEERDGGDLQWDITGTATVQGAAGGCEGEDLEEGLDWQGTETITVVSSEDESIPEDCTYTMTVSGVFLGGG